MQLAMADLIQRRKRNKNDAAHHLWSATSVLNSAANASFSLADALAMLSFNEQSNSSPLLNSGRGQLINPVVYRTHLKQRGVKASDASPL